MTTYNFSELSSFEFETLCHDLLQAELQLLLELFAPGPDRGIDIRYIGRTDNGTQHTVVQCKRWAANAFPKLLRHLKTVELPKINKLAPARYILMTSVPLTPDRKDKIAAALNPWSRCPADVMGRDDLSSLLARHPEIERRHIKLWLTSTEVLDALLNSDIAARSEGAIERAQRQLRLWVPNPSFARAREILDAHHVCVISGAPGIGKTMLANVLLADYASREYQPVVISADIEEGERAWRSNRRQIFQYDDFLGHVTYGEVQLRKNEESSLAQFIERVRKSDDKKFILTTREYILSEAERRYERISRADFGSYTSIVSLDDYTPLIRARILYNHLFFSDLPHRLKTALVPEGGYWDVIRHRNYNPRVIEQAVSLPSVVDLSAEQFVSHMLDTLEDPAAVWRSIFDNLPQVARRILRGMASLPSEVLLEDLRAAVHGLSPGDFEPSEFQNALSTLEGTFLTIGKAMPGRGKRERIVAIRDPSVRDYLWGRLEEVEGEAESLLESAVFFEQCVVLYEGRHHADSMSSGFPGQAASSTRSHAVVDHEAVASRALELIRSASPLPHRWESVVPHSRGRQNPGMERRASFLMGVLAAHPTSEVVAASAASGLKAAGREWEAGEGSPSEGLYLLRQAKGIEPSLPRDTVVQAETAFLSLASGRLDQMDGFTALVGLAKLSPWLFSAPYRTLESWGTEFRSLLHHEEFRLLHELDDPDWIEEELGELDGVADALGVDIGTMRDDVEWRIVDLQDEARKYADDDDWRESHSEPEGLSAEGEVDALFQSLL